METVNSSRKVIIEFSDAEQAASFEEEMKRRFNYPKTDSKYRLVHGFDDNGNAVFVSNNLEKKVVKNSRNVFSSVLKADKN